MKKMKAVLAVLITAGILAGCAGRGGTSTFEPKSSGIFVTDAGTFSTATVETYDNQDYYNEEEWKTFLEENVAAYNAEHGEGAVTLQTCSLKAVSYTHLDVYKRQMVYYEHLVRYYTNLAGSEL